MVQDSTPKAALAGVRVLDLSRALAGPWATQILGDLGADVIKVEKPGAGDESRSWGPPFLPSQDGERGDAAYYLSTNRNKRSVAIDIAKPAGAELVRRLASHCQILVENFKTGGLRKYALDYESIRAVNPSVVYCAITGFGQTGPYAKRPGYDYIIQGMGGLMSLTGEPDGPPMKVAVAVADLFTGMYAVTAILAALRHAERTGEGQFIDTALLDCQIAMLANLGSSYLVSGQQPPRVGNQHMSIAPYAVFATSDGHIILAVANDAQFRAFCTAAALNLADDPRFATNESRVNNSAELTAAITPVMRTRTTAEWVAALEKTPSGPINSLDMVFSDPHVLTRRVVESASRSDGAEIPMVASPLRMTRTPPLTRHAPPRLGEHTEDVLRELLGADEREIARWRDARAI